MDFLRKNHKIRSIHSLNVLLLAEFCDTTVTNFNFSIAFLKFLLPNFSWVSQLIPIFGPFNWILNIFEHVGILYHVRTCQNVRIFELFFQFYIPLILKLSIINCDSTVCKIFFQYSDRDNNTLYFQMRRIKQYLKN